MGFHGVVTMSPAKNAGVRLQFAACCALVSLSLFSSSLASGYDPTTTGASLPTGAVTISWTPPTENTNGSVLTNLAGYHLYYGTTRTSLNHEIKITNPGLAAYVVSGLSAATWYFALTAVNTAGSESPRTAVQSHLVR